ncbi:apolipoprotein N-acyltransferase [Balneola sp. MJW-20]|uniref:apolipoprotein N-acyltransferase n=1 Tax=Gracilimonas aurantiaca TaxID=3234185 RepID=UPI0034657EF6
MKRFWSHKLLLSISSGILLGLSFPPLDLSFLSIPAFILIFRLVHISDGLRQAAYYLYPGLVIWNLITTYWLMMADIYAGIAAILANSAVMTIPLCLAGYFEKKLSNKWMIVLLQTTSWVSYEYLHHLWDLSWPWLAIGNAWANYISLIQYISVTGHLGITLWVVLTAALLYRGIEFSDRSFTLSALFIFILFPAVSFISFQVNEASEASGSTLVTVVQPNHDSYQDFGGMSGIQEVMDSLFSETERHLEENTELIIWPENAIDKAIYPQGYEENRIADSARSWNSPILTGTGYIKIYNEGEEPAYYRTGGIGRPYNIYNTALFVDIYGKALPYFKANLVPIVERVPFLPVLIKADVFDLVPWNEIPSFGKGSSHTLFSSADYSTPGLVCYDSVYPTWIRPFVQNGATFITIITNDGWWGDTSGHHQHFAYARLRAIEFDRWVVRSANNGISGIIAPDGTVKVKTGYWTRTGFSYEVPDLNTRTFYTRFGDWLAITCLFLSSGAFIFLLIKSRLS